MILGFAHITKNESGYAGLGGENPPEKWPLMERHAKSYYMLLEPQRETIWYDTGVVEQPGRLGLLTNAVSLRVRELAGEVDFLWYGLGFHDGDGLLHLSSAVESWKVSVRLWVEPEAPIDPPLDIAGYAALAFYSSDVEADRDHLLKHGGRTPTDPFTVKLDREMKIVMLRSPEGTIIELIQVLK